MPSASKLVLASNVVLAAAQSCPGSSAWPHASCSITATTSASCEDVADEIMMRASHSNDWTDPHNGGIYTLVTHDNGVVNTQRTTNPKTSVGGKTYTDKQRFTLSKTANGGCEIQACSESQGTSIGDFSTNYCDLRNLYCGSSDGCKPVKNDFATEEKSVKPSIGASHDFKACIVKKTTTAEIAAPKNTTTEEFAAAQSCPGSSAWPHASCSITATTPASCDDVADEIMMRASHSNDWTDPHNGGIYTLVTHDNGVVNTQRTTNPKTAVGGKTYTDKQRFTLSKTTSGGCEIQACSESQGVSVADFSTNYCDLRNLYCGSSEGCKPVKNDFATEETSVKPSIGASHDSKACIVKKTKDRLKDSRSGSFEGQQVRIVVKKTTPDAVMV